MTRTIYMWGEDEASVRRYMKRLYPDARLFFVSDATHALDEAIYKDLADL